MDHRQACPYCPHYKRGGCTVYVPIFVDRRVRQLGCPSYPYRQVPRTRGEYVDGVIKSGNRVGQQHQKKSDRSYNNRKSGRKYG